jgi:hypothetical protein
MDSSIHAHLVSQYVKDRIEQAEIARAVAPRGVRLPRIAWRHSPSRRRPRAAALGPK